MRSTSFSIIFLFMGLQSIGQINYDSLLSIWHDPSLADTIRLEAVQKVSWDMVTKRPDSSLLLAEEQLDYSRSTGNMLWESKALNTIGAYHYHKGNYAESLKLYKQVLEIKQEINDMPGMGAVYNNLGNVYRNMGNGLMAVEQFTKAQNVYEELGDTIGIASSFNNMGIMYHTQEEFQKALLYYKKGLSITEKHGDPRELGLAYNNIGAVYSGLQDFKTSLEYYAKSLEIRQSQGDQHGIAVCYGNMGLNYIELKEFDKAIEYINKSIEINKKFGFKYNLSRHYYNLGSVYNETGDYSKAIKWCKQSLEIAEEIEALPVQRISCYCIYKAYKSLKDFKNALEYHERFKNASDSLQNTETEQKLMQIEFSREILADSLSREEEKLKMIISHQSEIRKKNHLSNILLATGTIILLFAIGFLSRMLYFRKSSEAFQLKAEQLEKQKLRNEIDMLRTQVNPHFLFNSLSILSSLVHLNPNLAEQFIDQLSKSYRYILEHEEQNLVSLRTELEFLKSYTFLLKIRFEDKFDIVTEFSDFELDNYAIAPLTLQLLIENAVKHNKMSKEEPLTIEVSILNKHLIVKNNLSPRSTGSKSTGIGLKNIKERYLLLTNQEVTCGAIESYFVVQIPLISREKDLPGR